MAKHQCSPNTIGAFLKGVGILRLHIDEQNNLIVTYTNGATQNVGPITPCDSELDDTSERPLMNKAIAGLYSHIIGWIRALDADLDERVSNKVDKVPGKGLSSNDFTNANYVKLAGLRNYDDTEVREDISNISESIRNIIDGGGRDVTIEGVRAIEKFLDGCSTSEPLINIRKDLLQHISEVALIIKDNSNDIALNRERITNSEFAINGARREIVTLKENVLAASENVTDNNTRVEALGNRVAAAENDVATFDGRVDGIENTLLNHKERLNSVEARERENKENVSTLLAFQTKATQQITDAEAEIQKAKEDISINRFGIQANNNAIRTQGNSVASLRERVSAIGENVDKKQDALTLTVKDNGNIVIGNIEGQTKEFMPATPSGDPMHYYYLSHFGVTYNAATGFFELEYLKNLTANDMRNAVRVSGDWRHMFNSVYSVSNLVDEGARPRTNIAMMSGKIPAESYRYPRYQPELEQFIIGKCSSASASTLTKLWGDGVIIELEALPKLRFIVGNIDISTVQSNFLKKVLGKTVTALEEVRLTNLKTSQSILYQTKLSKQSIQFLLENRANTAEISLGLPAVIYNKIMTDGGEWADLRTLCQASGGKGAVILEQNA